MFRTELQLSPLDHQIDRSDRVLALGSCFTEHIGGYLEAHKLSTLVNPFGTLFQPLAMVRVLYLALRQEAPDPRGYIQLEGRWVHIDFHSRLSAKAKEELERLLLTQLEATRTCLLQSQWLLLTLGTAWVYEWQETGKPVANCHKLPNSAFRKRMLSVAEMSGELSELISMLSAQNPALRVMMTVSPVRHQKDGLVANSSSKASLRLTCDALVEQFEQACYFPAYELLLDDLRDYRFYASDMLHPSSVAIDYIIDKFKATCINPATRQFLQEWEKVRQGLAHRAFHPKGEAHQRFLVQLRHKVERLQRDHRLDASRELAQIDQQLT